MEKSCGTIIVNEGKVLIIEQSSGFYGFPKGHVEGNETEVETAIRETKEEVNIDVVVVDESKRFTISYIVKETIPKTCVFFLARPINLENKPQEGEVNKILWVDIDKVYDTLTHENAKEMWLEVKKYI